MKDFEIVTTSLNNPEWVELLLFSLGRTLSHKERKIVVYDQGKDPAQVRDVIRNHPGLHVELHHEPYVKGTSYTHGWKRALSFAGEEICFCHADVCFLMKGWDGKITELREKHSLVATGCGGCQSGCRLITGRRHDCFRREREASKRGEKKAADRRFETQANQIR